MGCYKGTLQCHFKIPFALTDIFTFRDGHYAILIGIIPVYFRTLSHFEIFFGTFGKQTNVQKISERNLWDVRRKDQKVPKTNPEN